MLRLRLPLAFAVVLAANACDCGDDTRRPTDGGPTGDAGGTVPECWVPDTPGPTVTTCDDTLEPPAEGTCTVTAGTGDATLIVGDVLTPGEVFRGGQVLVDGSGTIACVGCDCAAAAGADTATRIVCPEGVVSPGLINPHEHITYQAPPATLTAERYEHRHDWREGNDGHAEISSGGSTSGAGVVWGELRHLLGGATSVNGSGVGAGLLRNLDRASGLLDLSGLEQEVDYDTFPLGDVSGTERVGDCSYDASTTAADVEGLSAYTPHIAEGIEESAHNEFLCTSMEGGELDIVEPQTAVIHGIAVTAEDIGQMSAEGSSLIWSPRSNIALYGDTARVSTYASLGVRIALGTDWLRSGSMNLLRELACADSLNATYFNGYFTDEELWLMVTRDAAESLAMESIGVLAEGRRADITIFDASERSAHRAILEADSDDVVLVLRSGQPLFGDEALVTSLASGTCDTIDVCGASKRVCVGDTGLSLAEILAAGPDYDVSSCGVPEGEPPCVPERNATDPFPTPEIDGSTRYSGEITDTDTDGDGIEDAMDNCRCTFNPVRPMDGAAQADSDGDGFGDECDPCPLDADTLDCTPFDPTDRDRDGVPNDSDNCPADPNPDQADGDEDGKGDLCDACPEAANPGTAGCPGTVYEVRDGTFGAGTAVALEGSIVTAVASNGFFMQVDPASAGYTGPDLSGIFVFTGDAPAVARGDVVDVTGPVADYFGQAQIEATEVSATGSAAEPAPVVVEPAEIATGGARAEALEGVLVRVETVTVGDPDLGFGEFSVDDGLRVDDTLYLVDPWPGAGEMLSFVQGPLGYSYMNTKVLPRDALDVAFSSLRLTPSVIRVEPSDTVVLTVLLPTDAPAGGASVTITPAPAGLLTGPATLDVPEGMRSASGTYTASAAEDTGTVTASYGGDTAMATVTVAAAPRLLFSEYVEGSSSNKALEIANVGGSDADLGTCEIRRYTNGGTSPTSIALSGTLAAGDLFVVCHGSIEDASACDLTSGSVNHNGNDAYDLYCMGAVVDTFGTIGTDPGTEWAGGGLSTVDHVLTRKCSVTMGDTDGSDDFDPSVGWEGTAWVDAATSLGGLGDRAECP